MTMTGMGNMGVAESVGIERQRTSAGLAGETVLAKPANSDERWKHEVTGALRETLYNEMTE